MTNCPHPTYCLPHLEKEVNLPPLYNLIAAPRLDLNRQLIFSHSRARTIRAEKRTTDDDVVKLLNPCLIIETEIVTAFPRRRVEIEANCVVARIF